MNDTTQHTPKNETKKEADPKKLKRKTSIIHCTDKELQKAKEALAYVVDVDLAPDKLEAILMQTTDIYPMLEALCLIIDDEQLLADGIKERMQELDARKRACELRISRIKTMVHMCLDVLGENVKLPTYTLSLKASAPKLDVTDEALIPVEYWQKRDPVLDRKALLKALKDGTNVEGAELVVDEPSLQIRK